MKNSRHGWLLAAVLLLGVPQLSAQTQNDMNQDACGQYKQADQALNATYSKVLRGYAKETEFLAKLKQAQRAWIAFRDAHLAARFPKADKAAEYGSSYPACRCVLLAELTRERVKELQVWENGIPEGDVCNGSVKTANSVPGNQSTNRQCSRPAGT